MRDPRDRRIPATPVLLMVTVSALVLVGCSPSASHPTGGDANPTDASPRETAGGCQSAPPALVDLLRSGIVVRGATLSNVYVAPWAGSSGSDDGWWVAGKLSGAGARPEVVVWVVATLEAPSATDVMAANAAASRYSRWTQPGGEELTGQGRDAAVTCVGPIPPA